MKNFSLWALYSLSRRSTSHLEKLQLVVAAVVFRERRNRGSNLISFVVPEVSVAVGGTSLLSSFTCGIPVWCFFVSRWFIRLNPWTI